MNIFTSTKSKQTTKAAKAANTANATKADKTPKTVKRQYSSWQVFLRLASYVIRYKWHFFSGVLAMIVYSIATASFPAALKEIINTVSAEEKYPIFLYILVAASLLGLSAVRGVAYYWQNFIMLMLGQRLNRDLRAGMFKKLIYLSFSFFNQKRIGDLLSRFTIDVNIIEQAFILGVTGPIRDLLQIVLLFAYMWTLNFKLFLISFILLVPAGYLINYFGRMNKLIAHIRQEKFGLVTSLASESISGVRVVKAFNMELAETRKFDRENNNVLKSFIKTIRVAALSTPLLEFVAVFFMVIIFIYGAFLISNKELSGGAFFSFVMAFFMVVQPLRSFNGFNLKMQEATVSGRRIFEILDYPDAMHAEKLKPALPPLKKVISIKIKSFAYRNKAILRDLEVTIKKGEIVAIVGQSGSGKTTLANLLPRFFELNPKQGKIKFDEHDISKYSMASLRQQIAIVAQDTALFNDTVRYNIAYGKLHQPFSKIVEASKKALAHEFIESFEDGYDQLIGEKGMAISGGQRQRIAIARAILKDAPILILDEATNALDTQSEKEVNKALSNLMIGRTAVIIAHKLATIKRVDRIFVMKEGRIIEQGDFKSLIKKKGAFRALYDASYSEAGDLVI